MALDKKQFFKALANSKEKNEKKNTTVYLVNESVANTTKRHNVMKSYPDRDSVTFQHTKKGKLIPTWLHIALIMSGTSMAVVAVSFGILMILKLDTTTVTINDSGRVISANTTADTVEELLTRNCSIIDTAKRYYRKALHSAGVFLNKM